METENFKHLYNVLNNEIKRIEPMYDRQADYQTNSKSYYDYLAKLKKLFELLSNRIWEYDEELKKRFDEWDKLIEKFPENVEKLLIEWLKDGKIDDIIQNAILLMGGLDEFREWDKTLIEKIKNEFSERANNLKWWGVKENEVISDIINNTFKNNNGKFFIPEGTYYLDKPIEWDIRTVEFISNGAKFYPTDNFPNNEYMFKPFSTSYDDRTLLTNKKNGGFRIFGNEKNNINGLYIGNPTINNTRYVFAHMEWENIYITNCNIGLFIDDNSYMIHFNHIYCYDNVYNLETTSKFNNAGENISFNNSYFTGSSSFDYSKNLNILGFFNITFNNCSFDWMEILGEIWGDIVFNDCHIETPHTKLNRVVNGEDFLTLKANAQISFNNGVIMINNNLNPIEKIDHLIYSNAPNQSININNVQIKIKNLNVFSKGVANINYIPKIITNYKEQNDYNFLLSDSIRNNNIINYGFDKTNDINKLIDDWKIESNAKFEITNNGEYKYLNVIANGNTPRTIRIYLKIPISGKDYIVHDVNFLSNKNNSISKIEMELFSNDTLLGRYDCPIPNIVKNEMSNYRVSNIIKSKLISKNNITHVRMVYYFNIEELEDSVGFYKPILNNF